MSLTKFVTPAIVVSLALVVVPVDAQHRGGSRAGGSRGAQGTTRGAAGPRSGDSGRAGTGQVGVAVPRTGPVRPNDRGGYYPGYSHGYVLSAPYYAFRPRVSLGFGIWMGYPVAYPYWAFPSPYVYGSPYPYSYSYSSPYPYAGYGYPGPDPYPAQGISAPQADPNTVTAAPGNGASAQELSNGGLSFEITPATAGVWVDGVYVGTASQFAATAQPLTLTAGRHQIELRAEGYDSMAFAVNVAPGQVIPYQGTLPLR